MRASVGEGPYAGRLYYGPRYRADKRRNVVEIYTETGKKTIYYARYLMEVHLNRILSKDDIVHHINGNPRDDRLENLEVTTRVKHIKQHPHPRLKW